MGLHCVMYGCQFPHLWTRSGQCSQSDIICNADTRMGENGLNAEQVIVRKVNKVLVIIWRLVVEPLQALILRVLKPHQRYGMQLPICPIYIFNTLATLQD